VQGKPLNTAANDTATRVLLAVLTQRRPTVRSVAAAVGVNVSTAHKHLNRLWWLGLVEWEARRAGTLRASCRRVPLSRGTPR
jgi:predicted ArsR family transcriptional regulator